MHMVSPNVDRPQNVCGNRLGIRLRVVRQSPSFLGNCAPVANAFPERGPMDVGLYTTVGWISQLARDLDVIPSGSLLPNTDSLTIIAKPSTVEVRCEDALSDPHSS